MSDSHLPLNRTVGELEDRKYREDFHRDSVTGFISGPGVETEFVTPAFDDGEVWDLRIQVSFSSEITDDVAILRLQNEAQDEVIVRRVIDPFEKNHFELRAVVTSEDVGTDGSRSPDFEIELIGSNDNTNYFITCRGIRLRRGSDTNSRVSGEGAESRDTTILG